MTTLAVRHRTVYRYANPVQFGDHRLMSRPRDSHDLRLLGTSLTVTPQANVRWVHDVFGNSIAILSFAEAASQLTIESGFRAEHFPIETPAIQLDANALTMPFSYDSDEIPDLGRRVERHYPDPERRVDAWARAFLEATPGHATLDVLLAMTQAVKRDFAYILYLAISTMRD
jgi:transglutaminase-like putative cysteine protease